ncbi:MAG: hypothetical protein IB616_01330 [Methanosarcinales archaeon]|nr:MAG: hypothetical protein IB616_01330 [Methanosarcinales archaeon]
MTNQFNPHLAWEAYVSIEEDFRKFIYYVPLEREHFDVWSLYLGDLMLRVGSTVDSFFRNALYSPIMDSADNIKEIQEIRKKHPDNINISDYRTIFEPFYQLSSESVHVLRTKDNVQPFSKFASGKSPNWWGAYNNIKHDRFSNMKEATLGATLTALAGLFLLNVLHLETRPLLVDLDIIRAGDYAKEFVKGMLSNRGALDGLADAYAKTDVFGYVFALKGKLSDDEKARILSPSFPGY